MYSFKELVAKFKKWWAGLTVNEKMMYPLIVVLIIAIATRWRFVVREVADAFSNLF
ncbi:MAG: hypothetical protein RSF93_06370 [Mucinivorans sp.]